MKLHVFTGLSTICTPPVLWLVLCCVSSLNTHVFKICLARSISLQKLVGKNFLGVKKVECTVLIQNNTVKHGERPVLGAPRYRLFPLSYIAYSGKCGTYPCSREKGL